MTTTKPTVIESERYATEQTTLMQDPGIIDMAEGLLRDPNAPKGADLLAWLDSYEGMMTARNVAQQRMIQFGSIGAPARAIRALIVAKSAQA